MNNERTRVPFANYIVPKGIRGYTLQPIKLMEPNLPLFKTMYAYKWVVIEMLTYPYQLEQLESPVGFTEFVHSTVFISFCIYNKIIY